MHRRLRRVAEMACRRAAARRRRREDRLECATAPA